MGFLIGHVYIRQISPVYSHYFGLDSPSLSLSLSLALSVNTHTHTHTFHSPHPIETGYQSYLLNLMHALSTHSHPVTSPLNIETGFSGITRTFIGRAPFYSPLPWPPVCDQYKPECAPNVVAPNLHAPLTHATTRNERRAQLIASIYCLMGDISGRISQF